MNWYKKAQADDYFGEDDFSSVEDIVSEMEEEKKGEWIKSVGDRLFNRLPLEGIPVPLEGKITLRQLVYETADTYPRTQGGATMAFEKLMRIAMLSTFHYGNIDLNNMMKIVKWPDHRLSTFTTLIQNGTIYDTSSYKIVSDSYSGWMSYNTPSTLSVEEVVKLITEGLTAIDPPSDWPAKEPFEGDGTSKYKDKPTYYVNRMTLEKYFNAVGLMLAKTIPSGTFTPPHPGSSLLKCFFKAPNHVPAQLLEGAVKSLVNKLLKMPMVKNVHWDLNSDAIVISPEGYFWS